MGQVLDTLRESGLDKNTLVIFTSDNGPWLVKGKDGGEAGPLRGGKGSTWEGGMREPTIAWWPGHVPVGQSCDTVAGTIDLLPTFVSLAGGKVPADRKIDGADISKLLLGQTKEPAREAHFYFNGQKLQAVRSGPWKLALMPQASGMGTKDEVEKGLRLYNLENDIGEKTNVADANPEIVKKLQSLAEKMAGELGGDGSGKGPGVRPPGVVENPEFLYPVKEGAAKGDGKKKAK
jgi:arylsulfatase A